jgi:hypothetical protein
VSPPSSGRSVAPPVLAVGAPSLALRCAVWAAGGRRGSPPAVAGAPAARGADRAEWISSFWRTLCRVADMVGATFLRAETCRSGPPPCVSIVDMPHGETRVSVLHSGTFQSETACLRVGSAQTDTCLTLALPHTATCGAYGAVYIRWGMVQGMQSKGGQRHPI